MMNIVAWDPSCASNAKSGSWCTAQCQDGFKGAYVSACIGTQWQPPSGACRPPAKAVAAASQQATAASPAPSCDTDNNGSSSSCYPDPSICWGVPPGPNPPDPNSMAWPPTAQTYHDMHIEAQCQDSLIGSVISYCIQGVFTQPVGHCYRDPSKCYSPPANLTGAEPYDWSTFSSDEISWDNGEVAYASCKVRADVSVEGHGLIY
jgi:hypothetical protein